MSWELLCGQFHSGGLFSGNCSISHYVILKKYSSNEKQNDQIDIEIQCDILFIITCICENDSHRKVNILIYY